jgi:peptide/nickel transport system substrate-binding protein
VLFNTRNAPLDDALVREALMTMTDRRALAEQTLKGQATPHQGLFAPGLWLSSNAFEGDARGDAARAEKLLTEAGWLRGINEMMAKSSGSFVLKLIVPAGDAILASVAADMRVQWLKLGVQVNVMVLPQAVIDHTIKERSFDAVLQRTHLMPSWDLWAQWHSDEPGNVTGIANRQIDLLLEALSQEFDPLEAAKRCQQLETMILQQHAVLPLLTLNERALLRTSLAPLGDKDQPWTLRDLLLTAPR